MKNRLFSLLLILALLLTMLPPAALAAEPACAHEHTEPHTETFENTRGSFCMLLWKMAGCPEPTIENSFQDLSEEDEYYKAVLWAQEKRLMLGTTETTFSPEAVMVRGQAVTFLWRYAGTPDPKSTDTPFVDLKAGAYYVKAVAWAAEQDWLDLQADGERFHPESAAGDCLWEGTACADCGKLLETTKLTVSIATASMEGKLGDDLEWRLADGALTITGSGVMPDLAEGQGSPWNEYVNQIQSIELPEGLLNIGDGMFSGCWQLGQVAIPDSVERIGNLAFAACGLSEVIIGEGVKSIGDEVFMNCTGLRSVSIPKSVIHVGYDAFGSGGIFGYWENGIRYLDDWVIGAQRDVSAAQIKPGTRGIADRVFEGFDYLTSAELPDSLLYIGVNAFASTALTGVKLPNHLQGIYGGAFFGCYELTDVRIPESVVFLGDGAFFSCASLKSVTIPQGLTELGFATFAYCMSLTGVELPPCVEFIGEYAFYDCDHLTSLTIANKECMIEEAGDEPGFMLGDPAVTTIFGYAGSTAEAYAKKYGYRFTALSEKVPFMDVPEKAFYEDPVAWAVENEVTKGVDDGHFGPNRACTRGQVVTFLWRAAGSPEPENAKTSFTDVKPGAFYEKAVAWAVENKITNGLSSDKFGPDATCTRGQIVTFLWRFKGSPEPQSAATPFTDLKPGGFYGKAVAWAVEKEITKGMTATTFAPDATCTRGQVVTFLYRATAE